MRVNIHIGVVPELIIQIHNLKCVQQLPLIGVDALDLYIEYTVRVHVDTVVDPDVLGQTYFVLPLDGSQPL